MPTREQVQLNIGNVFDGCEECTPEVIDVTGSCRIADEMLSSGEQEILPLPGIVEVATPFAGFEPLSNEETTYAYNRFLSDVVPGHTLGCIRLVARMMYHNTHRKASSKEWQLVACVSEVGEFIKLSERTAYSALKEAEDAGFITCVRAPQKSTRHTPAIKGIWKLNTTLDVSCADKAFYEGEKYRTPLPNHLVLHTIMEEDLVVVKFLCAVARYTIGYAEGENNQQRRLTVDIGGDLLREYAGIGNKNGLVQAKRTAVAKHLVKCEAGPGGRTRYGLVWSRQWDGNRSKLRTPEVGDDDGHRETEDPGSNRTPDEEPQQKSYPDLRSNRTSTPAEIVPPAEHGSSKDRTPINRVSPKQGLDNRQHETGDSTAVRLLLGVGYDRQAAAAISDSSSLEIIGQQVDQFEFMVISRQPEKPLGMLRKAIKENWGELDGFQAWKAGKEQEAQGRLEQRRSRHRSKYRTPWLEYVDRRIQEIEAKNSKLWREFLGYEAQLLEDRLATVTGPLAEKIRPTLVESFGDIETRRKRALEYFKGKILDFWEWDETFNPEGMNMMEKAS